MPNNFAVTKVHLMTVVCMDMAYLRAVVEHRDSLLVFAIRTIFGCLSGSPYYTSENLNLCN